MKTVAKVTKWNKSHIFKIFKEGEENDEDARSIVGFGLKKAKAILKHIDEIKEFVEEHGDD